MSESMTHSRANAHHPPRTLLSHLHGAPSCLLPTLALTYDASHVSKSVSWWHHRRLAAGMSTERVFTRDARAASHQGAAIGCNGGNAGAGGGMPGQKSLMQMLQARHSFCGQFSAQSSLHQSMVHSSLVSSCGTLPTPLLFD